MIIFIICFLYIPECKQSGSSTMCTLQPFLHMWMLVCDCECMRVSICELASTCILFRSSMLAVWWSLKHGNPAIISYAIPLLSTNGDPGGLLLESAQGRNYRLHIHTDTHIYVQTLTCPFYSDMSIHMFSHTQWNISKMCTYTLSSIHICIFINTHTYK